MKAFLLAAGLGTRLRPLTEHTPKCLVPINGKPLLAYWLELMEQHGITEVLINLHYLADQVRDFLNDHSPAKLSVVLFDEPELLGSGGTLRENKHFVDGESDFFILYADNLTNIDLSAFYQFHKAKGQVFSMALNRVDNPSSCGIATLSQDDIITSFVEKPAHPTSNLANAGVYIAKPEILDLLPNKPITDIGYDLLPLLSNRMAGWQMTDYLIDIGTFDNLRKAEQEWPQL